jgi:hypothetical protein
MNRNQLRKLIRSTVVNRFKSAATNKYQEYKILNEVPELIPILGDLMSADFSKFVKDIDYVAPKPPTFRVVLENDQYFYLSDLKRSWVAEVEGKRYYLLNLSEEERATIAISRILRYAKPESAGELSDTVAAFDTGTDTGGVFDAGGEEAGGIASEPEIPGTEEEFEA